MKSLKRHELEEGIDKMLFSTLKILKDLHLIHKKTAFEMLLATKVPGTDITIAKFINNLFNIIKPVIALARKTYPTFFAIIDWAEAIVRRLLKG